MAVRKPKDDLIASLGAAAVLAALTAAVLLLQRHDVVHSFDLVRDTNAIAQQPPWFGAISNLGILLWAVAAACYWFAYASLRSGGPPDVLRSLALGGGYSTFACLDDLFMIHEHARELGISPGEKAVLALHAIWIAAFVGSTWRRIRTHRWLFLVLCLGFFGGSTLIDLVGARLPASIDYRDVVLAEEVQKLCGITFWALFAMTTSHAAVVRHVRRRLRGRRPARRRRDIRAGAAARVNSGRQLQLPVLESPAVSRRVVSTLYPPDQSLAPQRRPHAGLDR